MYFDEYPEHRRFREAWEAVRIVRPVPYSLFTFGESVLPYYLVLGLPEPGTRVSITKGDVRIRRPMIITRDNAHPELRNFFADQRDEGAAEFLLARTAEFSNLLLQNESGDQQFVSDSVEEAVEKLNHELDSLEEDRVAVLTAPPDLGGFAVLRYAAEQVWRSGPDNIQELKERGFL